MMTRLSGPMVPSSIQSLIERRLAQLSEDSRGFLADAGVLGRRFKLSVLAPVLANVRREDEKPEWELAEELDMAVQLGLIVEEADDAEYDFTFSTIRFEPRSSMTCHAVADRPSMERSLRSSRRRKATWTCRCSPTTR